jgi:tetratricopeptide (TPR) repeat protein
MGRNKTESAVRYLHISRVADQKDAVPMKSLIQLYYKNNSDPGRLLVALRAALPMEKDPEIAQQVKNEIHRLEILLSSKKSWIKTSTEKARKYLSESNWLAALEEYKSLNAFNASDAKLLVEQGAVYENLKNKEKALDSYYDALLVKWDNPELNMNLGNYYLSAGNLALAIIHWKQYLETSPREGEYFFIQKRFQYFSRELRMKNLEKQIFNLSEEQTRDLYKIFRNMKVELGT